MSSPVPLLTAAGAAGKHGRATQLLAGANWHQLIRASITDVVRAGRSVMVVAPTTTEAMRLADELSVDFGARIVEVADQSDAALTTAWSVAAAQPGVVVIGTARVVVVADRPALHGRTPRGRPQGHEGATDSFGCRRSGRAS